MLKQTATTYKHLQIFSTALTLILHSIKEQLMDVAQINTALHGKKAVYLKHLQVAVVLLLQTVATD